MGTLATAATASPRQGQAAWEISQKQRGRAVAKGHKGRVAQVALLAAKHRSRSSLSPSNLSMRCPFTVEASSRIFPHLLQPQGRGKAAAHLAGGFQRHGAAKRGAHSPTGTSVTGARGPPAVPGYLLPSVHDASPGGCELCWRVPDTGKARGFCHTIAHVPRATFAPCQGSWAHLDVLPSSRHFPPLLPSSSDSCRQRGSGARSKAKYPVPAPVLKPVPPGP